MKKSRGEIIFGYFNVLFLTVLSLMIVYPLWYVAISSISNAESVVTGKVLFFPKDITFEAYQLVFKQGGIITAYGNTVFYTVVGTAVNLIFTFFAAYPLSKRRLVGRRAISLFILFKLWFSAGTIPIYLNFKDLNLLNNRAAIIIGFAVSAFYMVLLRTYFENIPESLEESAKLDGANDFQILFKIYVPLSIPAIMTIGLYYAVDRWNGYFWSMLLLTDASKIPLQVLLTKLIMEMKGFEDAITAVDTYSFNRETVVYATIVISTIPMLLLYPFIQQYFIKGIMVGAVKG